MDVVDLNSARRKRASNPAPAPHAKFTRPRAAITKNFAVAEWHAQLLRRCAAGQIAVEDMARLSNSLQIQSRLNDAAELQARLERVETALRGALERAARAESQLAALRR